MTSPTASPVEVQGQASRRGRVPCRHRDQGPADGGGPGSRQPGAGDGGGGAGEVERHHGQHQPPALVLNRPEGRCARAESLMSA